MPETGTETDKDELQAAAERADLDATLADAKVRFKPNRESVLPSPPKTDGTSNPPVAPVISEQAREIQQLRAQLHDAERMTLRVQKAASDYREQLTEAQADIAAMKNRWYAAEKARNAVSSQREVDSSTIGGQLLRAQKELERTQQLARSDMERAAGRIRVLEERLEKALTVAARAESSQLQYRKRSNILLSTAIALSVVFAGVMIYRLFPHTDSADPSTVEASSGAPGSSGTAGRYPRLPSAAVNVEDISKRPFVPHGTTKSLPEALGRLDRALKGFPGLDQEAILQQVQHRQSAPGRPVCSFEWANGQPTMLFKEGSRGLSGEQWAVDISRCADAVEQAH